MTDDWEKDSAINSTNCYALAIDQFRVAKLVGNPSFDGKPILLFDGSVARPSDIEGGKTYDIIPHDGGWRFVERKPDA